MHDAISRTSLQRSVRRRWLGWPHGARTLPQPGAGPGTGGRRTAASRWMRSAPARRPSRPRQPRTPRVAGQSGVAASTAGDGHTATGPESARKLEEIEARRVSGWFTHSHCTGAKNTAYHVRSHRERPQQQLSHEAAEGEVLRQVFSAVCTHGAGASGGDVRQRRRARQNSDNTPHPEEAPEAGVSGQRHRGGREEVPAYRACVRHQALGACAHTTTSVRESPGGSAFVRGRP